MKDLKGTIKTESRTEVQRVEGVYQAPQFVINDKIFYVYQMNESYVTSGVEGEHHVLNAVVCIEDHYSEELLEWFDLHMDYEANTWTLTKTDAPKEE